MTDPRIPSDLQGYQPAGPIDPRHVAPIDPAQPDQQPSVDPLGWCVIATTALLTWLLGPVALVALAAIGFVKYWRAWRSGRTDSNCILGDVRLILLYLAVLFVVGAAATTFRVL